MDIEYAFQNQCNPFLESYECHLPNPPDFTRCPLLEQLVNILRRQQVNEDRIESILYYSETGQRWVQARNEPLTEHLGTGKLRLLIVLKDCRADTEARIRAQILELQNEIHSLKEIVMQLKNQPVPQDAKPSASAELLTLTNTKQASNETLPPEALNLNKAVSLTTLPTFAPSPSTGKRDTDISYLYAVPFVREEKKRFYPLGNPIDACKEIESIVGEMRNDNKEVVIRINVGTFDHLRTAIAMRPRILHISCHGGYEMEGGVPKLYLYLEQNELTGVVEKYDVDTFRQWFQAEIKDAKEIRPRLVFVSACYSQKVGEAIKQAGVPNVIAVNSDTQVADEAATRFAKVLYHYLTLGRSVKEAFEQTKEDGKVSLRKLKLCCCTHIHKETCSQLDEIIRNREEAHAKHIPECDCEFGGNIHFRNCKWVELMKELSYEVKPMEDNPRKVRVCCCSPDLPHNEEEKFVLISQSKEAQDERIFDSLADAEPIVQRCFDPQLLPIVDEQLVGRSVELHKLVSLLVSPNHDERILAVMGPKGVGKGLLAKVASKYVMERGFFPDGVITISLPSLTWHLSKLNAGLLPPPYKEARNLAELGQKLKTVQKLVILQCYDVVETNPHQLIKILREVLEETTKMKFLILGKRPMNEEHVAEIVLAEDMDPLSAFTIIKRKNPDWPYPYTYFEATDLARALVTPWLAKKAAYMLKTVSADEVYSILCKENLISQSGRQSNPGYEGYVKSAEDLFTQLKSKCEELTPVYILAQTPSGLLESELQQVCEEEFGSWKEKAKDFISASSEERTVISCSCIEELKESKYKLTDAALRYTNEYLLNSTERTRYQVMCLEMLAVTARRIVRSFNKNTYKCLKFWEFSAIIDEGIWTDPHNEQQSSGKGLPTDPIARFQISKDNYMYYMEPRLLETILGELTNIDVEVYKALRVVKELALCTFTMLLHLERPRNALHAADYVQGFATSQLANIRFAGSKKIKKCLSVTRNFSSFQ